MRSLLSNPKAVGALAPSSNALSRLMASRVDPARTPVLEIGAGTGAITRALLDHGLHPKSLFVIEQSSELATFLRRKFPGVHVRCGDAAHSHQILSDFGLLQVRTIVSSLPLRNLSPYQRTEIMESLTKCLSEDGQILQYTYGRSCPISGRRFGLYAERLGRVWQNLPPATVWRFVHRRSYGLERA